MKIVPCVYANESGYSVSKPITEIPDALVDAIISYEAGSLDEKSTLDLFQTLIDTGLAQQLQGAYMRTAIQLIEAGLCTPQERKAA